MYTRYNCAPSQASRLVKHTTIRIQTNNHAQICAQMVTSGRQAPSRSQLLDAHAQENSRSLERTSHFPAINTNPGESFDIFVMVLWNSILDNGQSAWSPHCALYDDRHVFHLTTTLSHNVNICVCVRVRVHALPLVHVRASRIEENIRSTHV